MKILSYNDFKVFEAGQVAGKLEVAKCDVKVAKKFADEKFQEFQNISIDEALPHFEERYKIAQNLAQKGSTQRKDMPVIDEKDVKTLQRRLAAGELDVNAPFTNNKDENDAFPEGLTGDQANIWLNEGLPIHDGGKKTDDIVKVNKVKVKVGQLTPIQQQIYLDKCINGTAEEGVAAATKFLTNSTLIISQDGSIIDGHHRWMSCTLIDPNLEMHALQIELPIRKLLPMCLAYGDAVGNKRNA